MVDPPAAAEVRRLVVWLLQNRVYPLWQRLILVGHVCDRLQRMSDEGLVDSTQEVVEGFRTAVRLGLFEDHLNQLQARPATQLGITLQLIAERLACDYASPKFFSLFEDFRPGLGCATDSPFDEMAQRYAQHHTEHYLPFMARHDYMLEHYLVIYAFRTLFPYGTAAASQALGSVGQPIHAQYSLLVANFGILKTILVGLAGLHRSAFSPGHVAHAVQVCAKTFEHAPPFQVRVLQMLTAWGLKNPASMALLICE